MLSKSGTDLMPTGSENIKPEPVSEDPMYLFISPSTGSRTEQDKTQQTVTPVETAHASFTGGHHSLALLLNAV